ncbi:hypothetical protein TRIP_B200805 [uncultured Desulfatiglans sp.]|nr:hypothetical protein TRIP_B200805 [uncultured Desulfatiglans sp.]
MHRSASDLQKAFRRGSMFPAWKTAMTGLPFLAAGETGSGENSDMGGKRERRSTRVGLFDRHPWFVYPATQNVFPDHSDNGAELHHPCDSLHRRKPGRGPALEGIPVFPCL